MRKTIKILVRIVNCCVKNFNWAHPHVTQVMVTLTGLKNLEQFSNFRESNCNMIYLQDGFAVAVKNSLLHCKPHTSESLFSHPVRRSDRYSEAASVSPAI